MKTSKPPKWDKSSERSGLRHKSRFPHRQREERRQTDDARLKENTNE
jgi:hypothetical protein